MVPILVACSTACFGGAAFAQAALEPASNSSPEALQEIVVTAERRAERLQDVPISVSAFSTDQLSKLGIADARDLAGEAPNFYIKEQAGYAKPQIFMRGMGSDDFNATAQNAVAFYEDDVYLGGLSSLLMTSFDLDRIEVLRGPQGTLYGRNTTGGAIKFVSKQPSGQFEADTSVTYGRFNEARVEAGVGGPLADSLSGRFAGVFDRRDGSQFDLATGSNVDRHHDYALRGQLKWNGEGPVRALLAVEGGNHTGDNLWYHHVGLNPDGTDVFGYKDPPGTGWYDVNSGPQNEKITTFASRLTVDMDLGGSTLTSVSAFGRTNYAERLDTDVSPIDNFTVYIQDQHKQYSEELRLVSKEEGSLHWIAGLFAYGDALGSNQVYDFGRSLRGPGVVPDLVTLFPAAVRQIYDQHSQSYALFGEATQSWTDRFKTTVGLRWTEDRKSINLHSLFDELPPYNQDLLKQQEKNTWSSPTWRLTFDYTASRDILFYTSYNRGFKSGGYNGSALFLPVELTPYQPEHVDALEMGAKTQWLDRRLTLNADVFYNWFRDLQGFQFSNIGGTPVSIPGNAATARIYGAEIEVVAMPLPGLMLTTSVGVLHARYGQYQTPLADFSGNRLIDAPDLTLTSSAEYGFPVMQGWTLAPRLSISYTSKQYFDISNPPDQVQNGYHLLNAELSLHRDDDRLDVFLWGKNITDTHYNQEITPARAFAILQPVRGERASFGVTARIRF